MKEMNGTDWLRIAGKAILILLPFALLWAYIWFRPMAYADEGIPNYLWMKEQTGRRTDTDYQVVFLGDSVGNSAVCPELLSETTVNFALGGQTPAQQYYVLKNYLAFHRPPKVCYITFVDDHLQQERFFYTRTLYSHVLLPEQEWEIIREAKKMGEKSIAVPNCERTWAGYAVRLPSLYLPALINAGFFGRAKQNQSIYRRMTWHRGTYITRGVTKNFRQYNKTLSSFYAAPFYDMYYRRLLKLCEENGIRPRIVRPPGASDICSARYKEEARGYYAGLRRGFPSMTFDEMEGGFDYSDFSDIHHMNNHGSYKFSKRIKAMYPEDFADDTPVSRATVEGILDYIRMENRPDMLLKWIEGKPLTAVCFLRRPDAVLADKALADTLRALPPGAAAEAFSASGTRCLVLRGDGVLPALSADADTFTLAHPAFCAPITFTDHTYTISAVLPGEKGPRPVVRSNATAFSVVILDDQTGRVAAIKNFFPLYGTCTLMQD